MPDFVENNKTYFQVTDITDNFKGVLKGL
jgi:hypothetical protein